MYLALVAGDVEAAIEGNHPDRLLLAWLRHNRLVAHAALGREFPADRQHDTSQSHIVTHIAKFGCYIVVCSAELCPAFS